MAVWFIVYGLWFMVDSLLFMEDRSETKGTSIFKLKTTLLLYYSTTQLTTDY